MLAFFAGVPGPWELTIILVIAVLLFGKRLPSIARSLGSTLVEFKKGVRGIEEVRDEVDREVKGAVQEADKS